ncbi:MAG: hypothetical protein [Circoviridae sp.]|nr:MAG: hypothetical protein [Circoviridae sp.]
MLFPSICPFAGPCVNAFVYAFGTKITELSGPFTALPTNSVKSSGIICDILSLYSTRCWFCFWTALFGLVVFFAGAFFLAFFFGGISSKYLFVSFGYKNAIFY